jgi:hypothetical protein
MSKKITPIRICISLLLIIAGLAYTLPRYGFSENILLKDSLTEAQKRLPENALKGFERCVWVAGAIDGH